MTDQPIKVLIVDDEEGIVDYLSKILVLKGYKAFTALDGPKAVAIFEAERPDISVLDVHLTYSPIDGVEVLEKIKQIDKSAECVMVTRITDKNKIEDAKALGATHYILKPVDAKDLVAVVNRVAQKIKERRSAGG